MYCKFGTKNNWYGFGKDLKGKNEPSKNKKISLIEVGVVCNFFRNELFLQCSEVIQNYIPI